MVAGPDYDSQDCQHGAKFPICHCTRGEGDDIGHSQFLIPPQTVQETIGTVRRVTRNRRLDPLSVISSLHNGNNSHARCNRVPIVKMIASWNRFKLLPDRFLNWKRRENSTPEFARWTLV